MNAKEAHYIERVKALSCGVCGEPGPSYAHHILLHRGTGMKKSSHFLTVPLCYDCHQSPAGIHGDRSLWRIRKLEELDVLADTIRRLS